MSRCRDSEGTVAWSRSCSTRDLSPREGCLLSLVEASFGAESASVEAQALHEVSSWMGLCIPKNVVYSCVRSPPLPYHVLKKGADWGMHGLLFWDLAVYLQGNMQLKLSCLGARRFSLDTTVHELLKPTFLAAASAHCNPQPHSRSKVAEQLLKEARGRTLAESVVEARTGQSTKPWVLVSNDCSLLWHQLLRRWTHINLRPFSWDRGSRYDAGWPGDGRVGRNSD